MFLPPRAVADWSLSIRTIPRAGTETPACSRRDIEPWFICIEWSASEYGGGGGDGEVVLRVGKRGGSRGCEADVGGRFTGDSVRRTGGGGRFVGSIPVRFARYGRSGGGGPVSSSSRYSGSRAIASGGNAEPRPLEAVVVAETVVVDERGSPRLGGGPKDDGSLSEARGRETCSAWSSLLLSLPFPIQPACDIVRNIINLDGCCF